MIVELVKEFEVKGKRTRGRPKKTWKMRVVKENKSGALEKKDAMNRARWELERLLPKWGKSGHPRLQG